MQIDLNYILEAVLHSVKLGGIKNIPFHVESADET
jgi:hypothetical protein